MSSTEFVEPFRRRPLDIAAEILTGFKSCAHLRYRAANLAAAPLPDFMAGYALSRLYRAAGFRGIHRGAFIAARLHITGASGNIYDNLSIDDGVTISTNVTLNLDAHLTIGARVTVSPFVRIYTATHRHGPSGQRCLPEVRPRPVVIEEGCWIGLGALITPGVVIGRGTVVSAGAVVTRSVPADSFVSGNPGRVVGTLADNADWMGPRPIRDPRNARSKPTDAGAR